MLKQIGMTCALLCTVFFIQAADTVLRFEDGVHSVTKRFKETAPGTFSSGSDGWTLDYKFPMLTYGFGERAVEQLITFPMPAQDAKRISVSVYNETETGHAFMIRLTGERGTEWNSPPVIMNGKKVWRTAAFDLPEFQNFGKNGKPSPEGKITKISLVVQQALTSRLASLGVARRGLVKFKDFTVSGQAGTVPPLLFNGTVHIPAAVLPETFKSIPLHVTRSGLSEAYPARSGIPFARGAVRNIRNIRLMKNGTEIPAGFEVLSRWTDGSLRAVRMAFSAGLSTDSRYALEYGTTVARKESGQPFASEKDGLIVVDTGLLHAEFAASGNTLMQSLSLNGKSMFTGLESLFDGKAALKEKKITLETNNPAEAVVRVSGVFAEGGYTFNARFIFVRNSPSVRMDYTFINRDGPECAKTFPDVSLSAKWASDAQRWSFGESRPFAGGTVVLKQDGSYYEGDQRIIKSTVSENGKLLKTMDRFNGIWHVETSAGTMGMAVADAWQNHPKTVILSKESFRIGLSTPDSICNQSKNPRNYFKGMAKTHRMILSFNAPGLAQDFVNQPIVTALPDYLCASGVFGRIAPVDAKNYPVFERVSADWCRSWISDRYFGDMYGFRDFGDYTVGRKGAVIRNLETGTGMAMLTQFVRSGDPAMLDEAFRTNMHYIDIDTCYADLNPKKPGSTMGVVFTHRPQHVEAVNTPGKHDLNYGKVGGHDWYPEVVLMYFLTGEEIFRDAALLHAEATYRALDTEFNAGHILAREYAWPLKNIVSFYKLNPDPRYLRTAAKVMNFFSFWRNAFCSGRLGNTLGQPGVCLEAIVCYYRETNDPAAARLLKIALESLVSGTYIAPDGLPSDALYNEDSRLMFLNALSEYCCMTGDREMLKRFVPYLYFHLQHPSTLVDSTVPWCGPEVIRLMSEQKIAEPIAKTSVPAWYSGFSRQNGSNLLSAELRFCKTKDEPFSITVSRIASMRLGGQTRGLVMGDWQGYPRDKKNELKQSVPELSRNNYGIITVTDPDGKEILKEEFKSFVSNIRTFRIPADGKTGICRIMLSTDDNINLSFQVSASKPGLAFVCRDSLPWLGTVYIPAVDSNHSFTAVVAPRRPSPCGARLTAPDGKVTERFCNPEQDCIPGAVFHCHGKGVWKLERSMMNIMSRLQIVGAEPLLCPSEEDAQVFADYGKIR